LAQTITQVRLKQHPHRYHFSLKDSLTRRQFLAIVGAGAGVATLALPGRVLASDCSLPNPIPGTLDGSPFHIKLPGYPPLGSPDPASNDAATITDFNGHVGLAYVRGMGTRIDKSTSQTQRLPFEVDLRFMKGEYLGADGRYHHGAFTLV
jgi:hypothetical protein